MEITQKRLWFTRNLKLEETGLNYSYNYIFGKRAFFLRYDKIQFEEIIEVNKDDLLLRISIIILGLGAVIYPIFSLRHGVLMFLEHLWISVGVLTVMYIVYKLSTDKYLLIKTHFIFPIKIWKENANGQEILSQLKTKASQYYLKHYIHYDKDIPPEFRLGQLQWLYDLELISKEELIHNKELIVKSTKSSVGFKISNAKS